MNDFLSLISQPYTFIEQFPSRITFALLLGLIFLFFLLVFYLFLLYKRITYMLFNSRNKHWSSLVSNLLTNFLLYADDPDISDPVATVMPKINKFPINRRFLKDMIYQQIIIYHANFTGHTSEKLTELFLSLNFDRVLHKKLKSTRREVVIQGIREIAQLQLTEFIPQILNLTRSKSIPIRMEAQSAHIILNKEHSFSFLDHMDVPILDWYQLVLIEQASHIHPNKLPDFSQWLSSSNPTVVKLCIKLIGRFQQFHAVDKLIELLGHASEDIKLAAIKVLGEFEVQEAESALLDLYVHGSKEIQLVIIQALGRIGSANQLDFLFSRASSEEFNIAFQAVNALKNHGQPGIARIKQMYPKAPKMNKEIINHLIGSQQAS